MSENVETDTVIDNLTESTTTNVTSDKQDGNPVGLAIVTEPEEDTATTITEPIITGKILKRYFLNVD